MLDIQTIAVAQVPAQLPLNVEGPACLVAVAKSSLPDEVPRGQSADTMGLQARMTASGSFTLNTFPFRRDGGPTDARTARVLTIQTSRNQDS